MKKRTDFTPNSRITSMLRRLWMWSRERSTALKRDGRKCTKCGCKDNLEVHHITGSINWNKIRDIIRQEILVEPKYLQTLCKKHHDEIKHD
jgi:hypothetical protein